MATKKVWVQVEVYDYPGGDRTLIEGVEIDKVREEITDLFRFSIGYGPASIFNTDNPYYTKPRTLAEVIREDYQRDPEGFVIWRGLITSERQAKAPAERLDQWFREHPTDVAHLLQENATRSLRDAFVEYWRRYSERSARSLLETHSLTPGSVQQATAWLATTGLPDVTRAALAGKTHGDDTAPFFSEVYLYTLFGKEDARTILSYVHTVARAAGVNYWNIKPTLFDGDDD